jgi:hypothetical protein
LTTEQIQQYLVDYGPMSVAVYASGLAFQAAGPSGGVSCSFTFGVDHAVLLVGYNSTHWFIKNSWGPTWGNNGFGYISKTNDCNLHTYIDVMQVDFGINPNPYPNPNPNPTPANTTNVILTVTMTDSFGDGWNGNILAFRQNGQVVAKFGDTFTTGFSVAPINFTINGKL